MTSTTIRLRVPKSLHKAAATTSQLSLSALMRQGIDLVKTDLKELVRAFERRFGSPHDEDVPTTFTAPVECKQTISYLAAHCHLSENQICVLALDAVMFRQRPRTNTQTKDGEHGQPAEDLQGGKEREDEPR